MVTTDVSTSFIPTDLWVSEMVSRYVFHWNRVKPGLYRSSDGNYEIIKKKDGWEVQYFDLWNGKKVVDATGMPTYSDAKRACIAIRNKRIDDAIRKLGKR